MINTMGEIFMAALQPVQGLYDTAVFLALLALLFMLLAVMLRLIYLRGSRRQIERYLCVVIGVFFWTVLVYVLLYTGQIRKLPELYNKGIPLYYLLAPAAYFFTLYSLFPQGSLKPRLLWLHLLPFIFGLIDILPYAMASRPDKLQLIDAVIQDFRVSYTHSYGFIPQKWHYIIKTGLAFIYLTAQWRLVYLFDKNNSNVPGFYKPYVMSFTIFYTIHILMQSSVILSLMSNQLQANFILQDLNQMIWFSSYFFGFSLWMLFSSIFIISQNSVKINAINPS